MSKFVLEVIDVVTDCISKQIVFEADMFSLLQIIDPESFTIDNGDIYELDHEDLKKIESKFNLKAIENSSEYRLRCATHFDERPYKVHTNRELLLMLNGRKPFAVFSDYYDVNNVQLFYPEKYFKPYVDSGIFVMREYIEFEQRNVKGKDRTFPSTHIIMYAKKGEEWRIEAYILLRSTWKKSGWSEALERMEGSLLGYEEWQNDFHINTTYDA